MKTMMRYHEKRMPRLQQRPLLLEYMFDVPLRHSNGKNGDARTFANTGVTTPAVNIIETHNDYRLEMVAPGMKKESFKIEVQDNILTVTYDHADNREGEKREWKYLQHEYNYHSFSRSFSLPDSVESAGIEARYVDGILHVVIPKKEHARTRPAHTIPVE